MAQSQPVPPGVVLAGFFTAASEITCQIPMRQRRLTDLLNGMEQEFIAVNEPRFVSLSDPAALPRQFEFGQINRESVIFATPYSGEPLGDAEQRRMVAVAKVPRRIVISLPPFLVEGDIHLLRETVLHDAFQSLRQAFLPLTQGTVTHVATGRQHHLDLVIINRARVEAYFPAQKG